MRSIAQIMTSEAVVVAPDDTLQKAAQQMRDWNIGSVPVCDGKRLVGMVTDRDITIRATASDKSASATKVSEVMSDQVMWCFEDQTEGEVLQQMGDQQVRRIPVVSRNMELVGIVSLGDLATHDANTNPALQDISTPSEPSRRSREETRPH